MTAVSYREEIPNGIRPAGSAGSADCSAARERIQARPESQPFLPRGPETARAANDVMREGALLSYRETSG